jgi:hypothetical protein
MMSSAAISNFGAGFSAFFLLSPTFSAVFVDFGVLSLVLTAGGKGSGDGERDECFA